MRKKERARERERESMWPVLWKAMEKEVYLGEVERGSQEGALMRLCGGNPWRRFIWNQVGQGMGIFHVSFFVFYFLFISLVFVFWVPLKINYTTLR